MKDWLTKAPCRWRPTLNHQGDYRIIFAIDDNTHLVTIVRVGHRREIYWSF